MPFVLLCIKLSSVPSSDVLVHNQFVKHVNDSALCRKLKHLVCQMPGLSMLQVWADAIWWE